MPNTKSVQTARGAAAKPEETKRQLIYAGLKLFGSQGFDNVTTRALATEAGVNQAAIPYHFGGKKGLYIAVAESVVDQIGSKFDLIDSKIESILNQTEIGTDEIQTALSIVYETFFLNVLKSSEFTVLPMFVLREYHEPGLAFEILYEGALSKMNILLTRIVTSALGLPPESKEAILRAHVLTGQMFGFIAGRPLVFRRMGWDGYSKENAQEVVRILIDMSCKSLGTLPNNEREGT